MEYVVSLWNRIGDITSTIAKNTAKFGGEIFGATSSVARVGWDIGTAPWNDAAEFNGFSNTLKNAWAPESKDIIKPLASAGGAIMKVPGVQPTLERINYINQQYIREPLTTFNLVQGDIASGRVPITDIFNPNEWRKAYTGAQDISFGQSVLGVYRSYYDPKFNIYDPREREQAFNKSAWGKGLSGGVDLGIQFFGDVTLGGAKAIKTLKAS